LAGGWGADRATLHGMTNLVVSSPAELISAVPFLIGFHPVDSLVVVAMHGSRVTFAVRTDLPESGAPEEEARAAVLHLATVVLQQQADAVTIIGYGEESRVTPAVLRISDAFGKARVMIVDELRVADGRYWSYLCTDRSCCPTEGRPCEPAFSVVAAEATYAGAVALPSREALEAQLSPVTGDDREAMTVATVRALLRLAALARQYPPAGEAGTGSDPQHAAAGHDRAPRPAIAVAQQSPPENSAGLRGDPPFHHVKDSSAGRVASASSYPALADLRLDSVLWAKLGLAAPKDEGLAESGSDLLSDEDQFFASVRSAGRLAVQEAERCYRTGGRLTDDDAAWLGVLLLHVPVRDYAWARTRTGEWELALWSDVMRRVEMRLHRQLEDRDVGCRPAQHRRHPGAMVEPVLGLHRAGEFGHAGRQLGRARRVVVQAIERVGEAVEIVDRPGPGRHRHGRPLGVPVRRHGNDGPGFGHQRAQTGEERPRRQVLLEEQHRRTVRHEESRHRHCFKPRTTCEQNQEGVGS